MRNPRKPLRVILAISAKKGRLASSNIANPNAPQTTRSAIALRTFLSKVNLGLPGDLLGLRSQLHIINIPRTFITKIARIYQLLQGVKSVKKAGNLPLNIG